jgi:dolichol-phosphate mannosyltransferase
MQNPIKLTVFIPAYKEADNLRVLIPRLIRTLSEIEPQYEILVVDTIKPMDDTRSVCDSAGGNIFYVNRSGGNAFGDAVRTGISLAKGEYFVSIDGDGSHDPEFIKKMYPERSAYKVVIASRYIEGGKTENSKILIFMSRLVNLAYSKVLNLNCKDVSNSFKLYRTEELKGLILKSKNFDIIEEILFKLKQNNKNLVILEIPFTFKTRMFGETKRNLVLFVAAYIFTLIKLRLKQ